jgi:hypothetical protein
MLKPRSIEAERHEFFAALGEAISNWAWIEFWLFDLYVRIVRAELYEATSAAFYSVINFNSKLRMVDAAAKLALTKTEDIAEWKALRRQIDSLSKIRNDMAHRTVYTAVQFPEDRSVYLERSFTDFREGSRDFFNPHYTRPRIQAHAASFEQLARRLSSFVLRLQGPPKRRTDSP